MSLFPFEHSFEDKVLFKKSYHLYGKSFFRTLPLSIFLVLIYHFFCFGAQYFPSLQYYAQIKIFLIILLLPLVGIFFTLLNDSGKDQRFSFVYYVTFACQKFLSLIGAILSLLLLPAIIFGIAFAIYFGLIHYQANPLLSFIWKFLIPFFTLGAFIPAFFAPILIMTDNLDANSAIEISEQLVKRNYIRTFLFITFTLILLFFIIKLPSILYYYFHFPTQVAKGLSEILLIIIGPWAFALLLIYQYDLKSKSSK